MQFEILFSIEITLAGTISRSSIVICGRVPSVVPCSPLARSISIPLDSVLWTTAIISETAAVVGGSVAGGKDVAGALAAGGEDVAGAFVAGGTDVIGASVAGGKDVAGDSVAEGEDEAEAFVAEGEGFMEIKNGFFDHDRL